LRFASLGRALLAYSLMGEPFEIFRASMTAPEGVVAGY